ncbi:unnamed protein product [Rhizopus stolonifer]
MESTHSRSISLSPKVHNQGLNNNSYFSRANDPYNSISPTQKPYSSPNNALFTPPPTPKSPSNSYTSMNSLIRENQPIIEPNGCFVSCKRNRSIFSTQAHYHHHFVVPVFAAAEREFATMIQLLFNYKETDTLTPKEDLEKTITWQIDNNQSLLTLSEFTHQNGHEDSSARKQMIENLGRRLGISTILVCASYDTINDIYRFLDQLVQSLDQLQSKDMCLWWSKVVLVVDQYHTTNDTRIYDERKMFLVNEMSKIMDRYQLSEPLSVLFISTNLFSMIKHTKQSDYYQTCTQRILWKMMEKHSLCERWVCHERYMAGDNLDDDDDSNSSCSDDMYTFATVIEYKDGKRKSSQGTRTMPQYEKLNSYPGDDGSEFTEETYK